MKARIVEKEEAAITSQRLGKYAVAAADTHAIMKELLDTVFFMRSVPRLQNEDTSRFSSEAWVESRRSEQLYVSSLYLATTSKDIGNVEGLAFAVVI